MRVKVKKNMSVRFQDQVQQKAVYFDNTDEARACSIAMNVALTVIPDKIAPLPETTEVAEKSKPSTSAFQSSQWSSAFIPTCFTKRFVPMKKTLSKVDVGLVSRETKMLTPQVLDLSRGKEDPDKMDLIDKTDYWKLEQERNYDTSLKHKLETNTLGYFAPILDWDTRLELTDDSTQEFDTEVEAIFLKAKQRDEQQKHWTNKTVDIRDETFAQIQTFPDHHGNFWQEMIERGLMALYPVVEETTDKDISLEQLEQIADRIVCEDLDFVNSTSVGSPEDEEDSNLSDDLCHDNLCLTLHSPAESELDQSGNHLLKTNEETSRGKHDHIYDSGCKLQGDSDVYIEGIDNLFCQFQDIQESNSPSDYGSDYSSNFTTRLCPCNEPSESYELACLWSASAWDNIQKEFVTELQFHQSMGGATDDLTVCALTDSLTPRADQLLQVCIQLIHCLY